MRRALAWVAVAIVAVVVGGSAWLAANPRPVAELLASRQLGRPVRIERLAIGWNGWLSVASAGISVANAPWGSTPDIVRLDSLAGEVAPWPLLRGELRLGKVTAAGLRLVLEHGPDGQGNWKRHVGAAASQAPAPIPIVADLHLADAELSLHTSSGKLISITGREATLRAPAADRPASLEAGGAYNGAAVKLSAVLQPGDGKRDARILATAAAGTLAFEGTLRDPPGFDGVAGMLRAEIGDLGQLLALFGLDMRAEIPLVLTGELTREGDAWTLAGAQGQLAGGALAGELALEEGARLKPDAIRTRIDLAALDLDALERRIGADTRAGGATDIVISEDPGLLLDAVLGIGQLRGGPALVADLRLHASLTPGRLALDDVTMAVAGGRLTGAATAQTRDGSSHLTASAAATGAEAEQILGLAGLRSRMLTGTLTARTMLATDGKTLQQAWRGLGGQVVVAMARGRVSRRIMALASTDIRELFGAAEGLSRVSCLLAVMVLRDGKGEITPLRVRSADGTLFGGGSVDLVRKALDLTLKTEGSSTGPFALDLPVRVTGSFDSPEVRPAINSPAEALRAAGSIAASRLPEGLRDVATGSPCLH